MIYTVQIMCKKYIQTYINFDCVVKFLAKETEKQTKRSNESERESEKGSLREKSDVQPSNP